MLLNTTILSFEDIQTNGSGELFIKNELIRRWTQTFMDAVDTVSDRVLVYIEHLRGLLKLSAACNVSYGGLEELAFVFIIFTHER